MRKLKSLMLILGIGLISGVTNAQQAADTTNMLKVGINGGIAVPSNNTSANLGVDVAYQYLVSPNFGLGIATGYNHFFGKDNTVNVDGVNATIKNNSVGVVPVAALLRYYPAKTGFYLGADLGYGFLVGDKNVASNIPVARPNGGFYIKPEIGYHNNDWNFFVQYAKVFTNSDSDFLGQKYNVGAIGVGVAYNIRLGK